MAQTGTHRREKYTLLLVNLASIMERADEALVPGAYREIGLAVHASPTGLGSLTLIRSLVQSACFPLAAFVAEEYDRANVIAAGAVMWALATFFVGVSSTYVQVAISRALNGIGLAIVVPAIQSLVADSTEEGNRGLAFGWLQFTGNFGSILGGLCSVLLAATKIMGIPGWRIAFHLIAVVSLMVGALVYLFALDPREIKKENFNLQKKSLRNVFSIWSNLKGMLLEARRVMQIRTFQVIVAQGVAGSFPWAALAFAPMWLELMGFSHKVTAFLIGMFVIAGSLGGLFGGYVGDILSKLLPNAGRIILSQISSGLAVPLAAILLLALPVDPSTVILHGVMLFVMGFCISWNAPATNNPIFAEIVPQKSRASVYALDRSFESVLASFAPPIVGLLAQKIYGYVPAAAGVDRDTEVKIDRKNAKALAKALYTAIGTPMALCCAVYALLYWTYPIDRDRAMLESENRNVQVEVQVGLEMTSKFEEYRTVQSDDEEDHEDEQLLGIQNS